VQRYIGSFFSVRKDINLAANLTVRGHVTSVLFQVYIRMCTHCCAASLILNVKYILNDINPCFDSLVDL
jgi:hypothetical protein